MQPTDLLDLIYESACDPARWRETIDAVEARCGAFDDVRPMLQAGAQADVLRPHLARAARLQMRFARLDADLAARDAALDRIAMPLAIVEADGLLAHANTAFERLVQGADCPLVLRSGRLAARKLADGGRLGAAIRAAAVECRSDSLALDRGGTTPKVITTAPLSPRAAINPGGSRPLALVVVSNPDETGSARDARLLGEIYGLTPAECRLATALGSGASIRECAGRFGLSTHTLRSQLRTVFAKTGVNRQSALIALLRRLSPPLRP